MKRLFTLLLAYLLICSPFIAGAIPPSPPGVSGYSDITAVFGSGSCSGYLKSDGTCDTPAGGGDVVGPASTTQYKIPLWSATDKTLIDGVAVGTAGQLLRSAGAGAYPAWSTETYAAPGAVGAVLYSDGTNWVRSAAPSLLALTLYGQSAGGGAQLSLGSSSGSTDPNNGKLNFRNATNGYIFSITSGVSGADIGWTLPTAVPGGANYLLNVDADGTMGYTNPATFAAATAVDAFGDIVALFDGGTCSGYLKSDGTCAAGADHDEVTLGATATSILELTGQAVGFDTQTATYVLAGPATGDPAAPTFRALLAGDIPTLNQNTTGTAAALASQYIDWNASSGGNSIANKPTIGAVGALATVGPTNLSSTDFGAFTCNGTTCSLDVSYQVAHAYLTALATGGTANQILGMNADGDGVEFKSSLNISVSGLTASRMLESNGSGVLTVADTATTGSGAPVKAVSPTLTGLPKKVLTNNTTNGTYGGTAIYFAQCAASMGFGQPAYIQSTGKPGLADGDGVATMPAIGLVVVASTDADTPCTILTHGVITDTDWNWTVGNTIYVADGDAGALTATVGDISDTNDVVQVMGIAIHADSIFVNPSLTTIVLE